MGLTITDGSDIEDVISNTEQVLAEKRKSLPDPKIVDLAQTTLSQLKKLTALFDWSDSTGIQAMQEGDFALLDEISLANDWVLEPERLIVLAESRGESLKKMQITAHPTTSY
ncbi:hypothetical protein PSTG_05935 [Puccinia striiformis f. sp. tritici PST-78]|uniref:ATPase dynein-related AAA domain-containing protein n=1 Tax=Puccinia striiformis f. sp. tritici PST-78 TaxID=1165861 RepID=A0A0L0VNL4_9BASI|nr:hypothetical protein PSTG_05935 [Puccinia striiformis f. sp. tritici PST-78]